MKKKCYVSISLPLRKLEICCSENFVKRSIVLTQSQKNTNIVNLKFVNIPIEPHMCTCVWQSVQQVIEMVNPFDFFSNLHIRCEQKKLATEGSYSSKFQNHCGLFLMQQQRIMRSDDFISFSKLFQEILGSRFQPLPNFDANRHVQKIWNECIRFSMKGALIFDLLSSKPMLHIKSV